MTKTIKVLCVATFAALFFGILGLKTTTTEAAGSAGGGAASRQLYTSNCARCHAGDGSGDTELGRLNDTPAINGGRARAMSTAKLTRLVSKGKGSMPGFGKKMTKAQIASVVAYVRGL